MACGQMASLFFEKVNTCRDVCFDNFCRKHSPLMTFDGVEVSVLLTPFIIAAFTGWLSW